MTRKVPIDWDDLELAFTMHSEEQSSYLDLKTGKVELAANDLTGRDAGLSEEEVETGFAEGYLVPIEPPSSSDEYQWMVEFTETVADRRCASCWTSPLTVAARFAGSKPCFPNIPPNASVGLHSTKSVFTGR